MKRAFFIVLFVLMFGAVFANDSVYDYIHSFSDGSAGAIFILKEPVKNGEVFTVKIFETDKNMNGEMRITYFKDRQDALKFAFECKKTVDSDKSAVTVIDKKIKSDSNIVTYDEYETNQGGLVHIVYWLSKELMAELKDK